MLFIVLNTIGFIQAIFLASLLLLKARKKDFSALIAGGLILVFGLLILNSLRILILGSQSFLWFEHLTNHLLLLIGPLVYLYTRLKSKGVLDWKTAGLHFMPFLLIYLSSLLINKFVDPSALFALGFDVCSVFFLVISLSIYLGVALWKTYRSLYDYGSSFFTTLLGFSLVWLANLVFQFFGLLSEDVNETWSISATLLLSILVVILCYQEWLMMISRLNPLRTSLVVKEADKAVYLKKIAHTMEAQKPFLQADFTLSDLSKQTGIPRSYLSKVINEEFGMSFNKYLGKARVEEFIRLAQKEARQKTIMALANEAGFRSSSTFYQAFKEHMQLTPAEYVNGLK